MTKGFERTDTVIIGSGMGAMTAARLLQDNRGDKIVMIEAHHTPGGMTHEFHRSGGGHHWAFASGLHYLGKPDGGLSMVDTVRYLTGDRIQWQDMPHRYDIFDWGDGQIGLSSGHVALEEDLIKRFPNVAAGIRRYLRRSLPSAVRGLTAINIANSLPGGFRRIALPFVSRLFPLALKTTQDVIESHVSTPELRAALSFQWGDYGQSPSHTAFGFHATIAMHYANGAMYPVGGPGRIATKALDMIRKAGGDIRAGQKVTEILVDADRATGVRLQDTATGRDYVIQANSVVSGIGARRTAELLPEPLRGDLHAELADLGRNISCCVLFLGLNEDPANLGFDGSNHWVFEGLDQEKAAAALPGEGPLYMSFGSMKDPASRSHNLEIMGLTDPKHFDRWAGLADARGDASYSAEKNRIAARILERVEERYPGFGRMVEHQELATPLTFGTYQRAADGAFYGLPATAARMRHRLASPRWPVKGLTLAGQDAMTPGILGAAAGGVRAAGVMLGCDKSAALISQIAASAMQPMRAGEPWNGFLKVLERVTESPAVMSFRLGMPDGSQLPFDWKPGQFLTVHAPTIPKTTLRSYTISSAQRGNGNDLRLTIKAQQGGRVSNWLHSKLNVHDLIEVAGPFGAFTFEPRDAKRLVLIGGGVGVTPFAAILGSLAQARSDVKVSAIWAFRNHHEILFRYDMVHWRDAISKLDLHLVLSDPPSTWSGEAGWIDADMLTRLVPDIFQAQVHVCGPEGLMDAMAQALPTMGVPESSIRTEKFSSSGTPLRANEAAAISVTFARQGKTVEGRVGQSLLDIAQAAGVDIPVVCGAGSCGACRMRLMQGQVKHPKGTALTPGDEAAGFILACQARPQTSTTVDA